MTLIRLITRDEIDRQDDPASKYEAEVISSRRANVRRAVFNMPQLERHVIYWFYGYGGLAQRPVREMASRLELSEREVWRIYNRAMDKLRRELGVTPAEMATDGAVNMAA